MDHVNAQKTLRQIISSYYHGNATDRCQRNDCAIKSKRGSKHMLQITQRSRSRCSSSLNRLIHNDVPILNHSRFSQLTPVDQSSRNKICTVWKNFGTPRLIQTIPNINHEEDSSSWDQATFSTRSCSISPQTDNTSGLPEENRSELAYTDGDQSNFIRACCIQWSEHCEVDHALRKTLSRWTNGTSFLSNQSFIEVNRFLCDTCNTSLKLDVNDHCKNIAARSCGSDYLSKRFIHNRGNEDNCKIKPFIDLHPQLYTRKLRTKPPTIFIRSMTNKLCDRLKSTSNVAVCERQPQQYTTRFQSIAMAQSELADTSLIESPLYFESVQPMEENCANDKHNLVPVPNVKLLRSQHHSSRVQTPVERDLKNVPDSQNTQTINSTIMIPLTKRAYYTVPIQSHALQITSSMVIKVCPECNSLGESKPDLIRNLTISQHPPVLSSNLTETQTIRETTELAKTTNPSISREQSGCVWLCGTVKRNKSRDPMNFFRTHPMNDIKSLNGLGWDKLSCFKRSYYRKKTSRDLRTPKMDLSSCENLKSPEGSVPSPECRFAGRKLSNDASHKTYNFTSAIFLPQSYSSSATDSHNYYNDKEAENKGNLSQDNTEKKKVSSIISRQNSEQQLETTTVDAGQQISRTARSYGSFRFTASPVRLDIDPSEDRMVVDVHLSDEPGTTTLFSRPDLANVDIVVRASLVRQRPQLESRSQVTDVSVGIRSPDKVLTVGGVSRTPKMSVSTLDQVLDEGAGTYETDETYLIEDPPHLSQISVRHSGIRSVPSNYPESKDQSNRPLTQSHAKATQEILVEVDQEPLQLSEDSQKLGCITPQSVNEVAEDNQQPHVQHLERVQNTEKAPEHLLDAISSISQEDMINPTVQDFFNQDGEICISHDSPTWPKLSQVKKRVSTVAIVNQDHYVVDPISWLPRNSTKESKTKIQSLCYLRGGTETETASFETYSDTRNREASDRQCAREADSRSSGLLELLIVSPVINQQKSSNDQNIFDISRAMQAQDGLLSTNSEALKRDPMATSPPFSHACIQSVGSGVEQKICPNQLNTVESLNLTGLESKFFVDEMVGKQCSDLERGVDASPKLPGVTFVVRSSSNIGSKQIAENDTARSGLEVSESYERGPLHSTVSSQISQSIAYIPQTDHQLTRARSSWVLEGETPQNISIQAQPVEVTEQQMQYDEPSFIDQISEHYSEQKGLEIAPQISRASVKRIYSMVPSSVVAQQPEIITVPTTSIDSQFSDLRSSVSEQITPSPQVTDTAQIEKHLSEETNHTGAVSKPHRPIITTEETKQPRASRESVLEVEQRKLFKERFQMFMERQIEPDQINPVRQIVDSYPSQVTRSLSMQYPNRVHEPQSMLSSKRLLCRDNPNTDMGTDYPYPTIVSNSTQPGCSTVPPLSNFCTGRSNCPVLLVLSHGETQWRDPSADGLSSLPSIRRSINSEPQCLCPRSSQCPRCGFVMPCSPNFESLRSKSSSRRECCCHRSSPNELVYISEALYPNCYDNQFSRREHWNKHWRQTSYVNYNIIDPFGSTCTSLTPNHVLHNPDSEMTTSPRHLHNRETFTAEPNPTYYSCSTRQRMLHCCSRTPYSQEFKPKGACFCSRRLNNC